MAQKGKWAWRQALLLHSGAKAGQASLGTSPPALHPAPHLLYGLKGEGELALDGLRGAQHIQDIQEVGILQREGWALYSQAVLGRDSTALGAGTHLPQGHPAIGILGGGRWHRTDWQGLELNSKLSAAPQGEQGDVPCPARSLCPHFPGTGSDAQCCPPLPARLSTLLMTVRMANSFSVGSPASERGAS